MYLAISKFLLEMPSLSLERTTCQGKKKKKKVGGEVFIFCKFWRTCSTRGTVLDTGDAKMNKTDAVCFFRANSIAGKAVIKQLITG